jgi:phage terminase small subunit
MKRSDKLTWKQRRFCEFYAIDWNGAKAYRQAYPGVKTDAAARVNASKLLARISIQNAIKALNTDLEKTAGISKLWLILEHKKIARNSIAQLHDTWITRKAFDKLTPDEKACIAEIDTKIKTEYEYHPDSEEKKPVQVEYIRVKIFDKQKSLEQLARLMGYNRDIIERLPDDQLDWLLEQLQNNKK